MCCQVGDRIGDNHPETSRSFVLAYLTKKTPCRAGLLHVGGGGDEDHRSCGPMSLGEWAECHPHGPPGPLDMLLPVFFGVGSRCSLHVGRLTCSTSAEKEKS